MIQTLFFSTEISSSKSDNFLKFFHSNSSFLKKTKADKRFGFTESKRKFLDVSFSQNSDFSENFQTQNRNFKKIFFLEI